MAENTLQIKKAVFYKSMKRAQDYPGDDLPQVAVAGKSNAGKSSLINFLVGHSKLAYVGKQPGKTRLVNFYTINDAFLLVDLPGYGFAKVSKAERKSWGDMMDAYFETAHNIRALLILTDIRHKPTADDISMVKYALYYCINFSVIATKADKIAKSKRFHYIRAIKKHITEATGADGFDVFAVSSNEKTGGDAVLKYISERLSS